MLQIGMGVEPEKNAYKSSTGRVKEDALITVEMGEDHSKLRDRAKYRIYFPLRTYLVTFQE